MPECLATQSSYARKIWQGVVLGATVMMLLVSRYNWLLAVAVLGVVSLRENSRLSPQALKSEGNAMILLMIFTLAGLLGSVGAVWLRFNDFDLLLVVLFTTAATDIFAQVVGRAIKGRLFKRKPFPVLSPNKTKEGLLGGYIGGVATFFVTRWVVGGSETRLLFGLLLPVVAIAGDLLGSSVKRAVGVKDFSEVLGEHGGVNDRVDSHLLTLTFAFMYYLLPV